ncbi:MAG: hypothetical protein LHW45_10885 [Candidatus Cloacimonetes bacterium]|nr:hypothetical protein [Candidatus Cloacimonadota bacterium]MDY0368114.1 hypothetical protein [Candidatus Syntrophosphaera sp.]
MASSLDRSVIYTYTLKNNVSGTAQEIVEATGNADTKVKELKTSEDQLSASADTATASLTRQEKQLLKQVTGLVALKGAVSGVTSGLITMGMVSESGAQKLQMLNAGFNILTGFVTGIQALKLMNDSLTLSLLRSAIVTTYNAVIDSPWKLALVSAGLGAAAGVAIAYGASGSSPASSTTTNNIYIQDTSNQAATANGLNVTIDGGRIL